ncbi:MAG: VWA domain-containing protein [Candidatus Acidiferrales bacterium]
MRGVKFLLMLVALCAGVCRAQTVGTNAPAATDENQALKVSSQLVVETVVVKDKKGSFVSGLTVKDFSLTEDGMQQKISFFEHQKLETASSPLPVVPRDDEEITIYKKLYSTGIVPESPGSPRYNEHRLLALYFDMTAMPPEDQVRALAAAETFVRTKMTSADLVAIFRYNGGSVEVLQDFTADRNRLLSVLQTMIVGEGQGSTEEADDASSADTGAAFGQDNSEFNIFNTDRQLSALQTAAKMLGQVSEKKSLVYFASGLRLNGIDNQAQLHATVDAAIRAGVSIWMVDARGLVAEAPLGDATKGSPGNQGMYTGAAMQAVNDKFQQSQDTMYALAADTGGKAVFDNNDLTRGIVQAQRSISDYYVVAYYTTNTAENGHFRKITIKVDRPLDAKLDYRRGYYANKSFRHFNAADKEQQLEEALMLPDPITDLTVAMEIDYFQLDRAEYFVPIIVKIPGHELVLAKHFGAEHTLIDFVCEIKDRASGLTVSNLRDYVNIKLSDETAAELARRPVEYDTGFTLFPGSYSIKFLARDDETGRIGTYQTSFVIPDLNKITKTVPISSVILSGQQVNVKNALYNAAHGKQVAKDIAANPLVEDNLKLIPSVTRVFSTKGDLYVYLQAYDGGAKKAGPGTRPASRSPLVAFVSLYRNEKNALESPAKAVLPLAGNELGMVPFRFQITLRGVAAGRYECQVSVLDPTNHRVAFWVDPVMIRR